MRDSPLSYSGHVHGAVYLQYGSNNSIYVVAANSVICRSLAVWVGPYTVPVQSRRRFVDRALGTLLSLLDVLSLDVQRFAPSRLYCFSPSRRVYILFRIFKIQESDLRRIGGRFSRESSQIEFRRFKLAATAATSFVAGLAGLFGKFGK